MTSILEKIEVNKKTILSFGIGIFIIIVATIRWLFIFTDYSQFILSLFIGLIFMYVGYDLEWKTMSQKKLIHLERRFDSHLDDKGGVEIK